MAFRSRRTAPTASTPRNSTATMVKKVVRGLPPRMVSVVSGSADVDLSYGGVAAAALQGPGVVLDSHVEAVVNRAPVQLHRVPLDGHVPRQVRVVAIRKRADGEIDLLVVAQQDARLIPQEGHLRVRRLVHCHIGK